MTAGLSGCRRAAASTRACQGRSGTAKARGSAIARLSPVITRGSRASQGESALALTVFGPPCYDAAAHNPSAERRRAMEIQTRTVQLSTPDGQMPAYECQPTGKSPAPAVIVIMEAFGLNSHIKDVTERVAREGYVAIAPDLYHRFGSPIIPYEDLPKALGYLQQLQDDKLMVEVGATIAHLKRQPFVRADRIGIMGFCMGGRVTFLAAARHAADLTAAVPFYGGGIAADSAKAPIHFSRGGTGPNPGSVVG